MKVEIKNEEQQLSASEESVAALRKQEDDLVQQLKALSVLLSFLSSFNFQIANSFLSFLSFSFFFLSFSDY